MRSAIRVAMLASCLVPAVASADIAPPANQQRVGFEFSVDGLEVAPDRAVFAYPCGGSNGAPIRELAVLAPGRRVTVGRRGGDCALYATSKAALDAWLGAHSQTDTAREAAADAFVASAGIVRCQGGPRPRHLRPASEPAEPVREVLRVARLDATACILVSASEPVAPVPTKDVPAKDVGAPATAPAAPPPGKGGCAGCALSTNGSRASGAALGLAAIAALGSRRRRGRRA